MNKSKFDWSKWGFWLALTLFFITAIMWIFQTYIFEKKPELKFEIISNEEVLIVNENINKLSIKYDQVDLLSNNKNISVLIFRLINAGKQSITQNLYDVNSPFGFLIKDGEFLSEPMVINSSDSAYFKSLILKAGKDSVNFRKLIIDNKEFVDIKCLILNQTGVKPKIIPYGKISGIKEMEVGYFVKQKEYTVWRMVFMVIVGFVASILSNIITSLMKYISRKFKKTDGQHIV
jgi:hypothetical protein